MLVIVLEALLALAALLAVVWWTMFAGRPRGELAAPAEPDAHPDPGQTPAPGSPKRQ